MDSLSDIDMVSHVVVVAVMATTLGNELLSSAKAVRNMSIQVFTQCASSTTSPMILSLYTCDKSMLRISLSFTYKLS